MFVLLKACCLFVVVFVVCFCCLASNHVSYSYGQPRTGNSAFAQYAANSLSVATALFRVVHNRDPVAHIPPMGGANDYLHAPQEIFYNELMTSFQVCDKVNGEDRKS